MSENTTRMYWPSPQEYSEAVQTSSSFSDEQLRSATVETTPLGLPRSLSGNFATVFCFESHDRKVALRCFLRNVADQRARYKAISKYVLADDLTCTVPVEYIEEGIRVGGDWYPVLKMEWVDGLTLNEFVNKFVRNEMALQLLASYFKEMTLSLRRAGIAHGDLQHDNILIADSELRLVDYDGMYVPELASFAANELGHPNYQHPGRTSEHFGNGLDNFSSWVIYLSLTCLSIDTNLWKLVDGGADCLLFRRADYLDPTTSSTFKTLHNHSDVRIRRAGLMIRHILEFDPMSIPFLDAAPSVEKLDEMFGAHDRRSGNSCGTDEPWYQQSNLTEVEKKEPATGTKPGATGGAAKDYVFVPPPPPPPKPTPPSQSHSAAQVAKAWIKELGKLVVDELNQNLNSDELILAGVKLDRPYSFGLVTNQRLITVRYWLKFDYIPLGQIGELVIHKPGLFTPHGCVLVHASPNTSRRKAWREDPIQLQGTEEALKILVDALPLSIPRPKGF